MVYDWTGKEAECRRFLVDEGKTQDDVLEFLKAEGFAPSKRAFQNQLKKWDFPSKRTLVLESPQLVGAIEDLWKQHVPPKEMLVILKEKGFDIGERKLARLRTSHGLYIRAPNASKEIAGEHQSPNSDNSDGEVQANAVSRGTQTDSIEITFERRPETQGVGTQHHDVYVGTRTKQASAQATRIPFNTTVSTKSRRANKTRASIPDAGDQSLAVSITTPSYPRPAPGELEARKLQRIHAESEKAASQEDRRSRRSKHDGSKYPSEIGLAQCMENLGIDRDIYRAMRTAFAEICTTRGIERKKGCDIWQTAKDDLIASIPELAAVFHDENGQVIGGADLERKGVAVDLICMDTTKNLRKRETMLSIRDAKKDLGLTPTQITQMRDALTQRLISAEFTNKTEMGEARWKELKNAWLVEMGLDQRGTAVLKACDVLCADIVKRLHEKNNQKRKRASEGIGSQDDAEQKRSLPAGRMMTTNIQVAEHGLANHEVRGTALSVYRNPKMMTPTEPAMSATRSYVPSSNYSPYGNYGAPANSYSGSAPTPGSFSTRFALANSTPMPGSNYSSSPTSGPYYASGPTPRPFYTEPRSPSDSPYPEIDSDQVLSWSYHKLT